MALARDRLPVRGAEVRMLGLPLPDPGRPPVGPGAPRLPALLGTRPLKRWRYLGAFGPELMLCAGDARIGPLPQRWWAVLEPGAPLLERTSMRPAGLSLTMSGDAPQGAGAPAGPTALGLRIEAPGMRVALTVSAGDGARPVEVASPAGARGWAWTRKVAGLRATGTIEVRGRSRELELEAMIDDSAGYHPRHTAWQWSTGVGRTESGERVAWNLVAGVHDSAAASERTIWIDGEPCEVGPVRFADDLSSVALAGGGELAFEPLEAREHRTNLVLLRSAYRQPFGRFSGELPNGLRLRKGYGVMEKHDVHW